MLTAQIHNEAVEAATVAVNDYIAKYGEGYPCGFAWVKALVKGNTKLGKSFIAQGFSKSYDGGFDFRRVGNPFTQDMNAKQAGAQAYVDVVRRYLPDVDLYVCTRLD